VHHAAAEGGAARTVAATASKKKTPQGAGEPCRAGAEDNVREIGRSQWLTTSTDAGSGAMASVGKGVTAPPTTANGLCRCAVKGDPSESTVRTARLRQFTISNRSAACHVSPVYRVRCIGGHARSGECYTCLQYQTWSRSVATRVSVCQQRRRRPRAVATRQSPLYTLTHPPRSSLRASVPATVVALRVLPATHGRTVAHSFTPAPRAFATMPVRCVIGRDQEDGGGRRFRSASFRAVTNGRWDVGLDGVCVCWVVMLA